MKVLIAAALCFGAVMGAYAQGVWLRGAGNVSCGEYLQLRATRGAGEEVAHWVQGYLSGFNMEARSPTTTESLPDRASTLAFLDKHCRDNPLDNVVQASNELIKALGGRSRHR